MFYTLHYVLCTVRFEEGAGGGGDAARLRRRRRLQLLEERFFDSHSEV